MKILDVPQSGSLAGQTSSRNRFGQYRRTRATPVNPNSAAQSAARARLTAAAAAWRTLSASDRAGWNSLGLNMQRTDSLGQTYDLTGQEAFVSVNSLKALVGDATLGEAPSLVTPSSINTGTLTANTGTLSLAFSPSPLGASERYIMSASPQRSAGRTFESDFRFMTFSATAATSPAAILVPYEAKFGTPVVGNRIFVAIQKYSGGFTSAPFVTSAIVA